MDLINDLSMEMNTTMKVSPTLIAVNQILALSSMELQQLIKEELDQNPALELNEKPTCNTCGELMHNGFCANCQKRAVSSPAEAGVSDFSGYREYDDYNMGYGGSSSYNDDDEFDPMTLIASEAGVMERLQSDLYATIPHEQRAIADYLIGSLDSRGFLSASVTTIAHALEVDEVDVESVLYQLQHLGPPGVGARDVRECLLLQLDYIEEISTEQKPPHAFPNPIVRQIVSDYLTDLGEHKYGHIAQRLGISNEAVAEARDIIKEHLTPFPVIDAADIQSWGSRSKAQYVQPDVIIRDEEGKLQIEVIESQRFFLRINPLYSKLSGELRSPIRSFSDDEKKHIQQYVSRARLFMSNVNQRRETMGKIARCLIQCQEEYIRHGVRSLKPLTRAQVAEMTSLHESTVSRATAGKYVMLPNHQVIPFSDFFTASLSTRDVIKEIVTKEMHSGKPLTDREIVVRLKREGIRVARRTVAKYRSQMGILPSTLR